MDSPRLLIQDSALRGSLPDGAGLFFGTRLGFSKISMAVGWPFSFSETRYPICQVGDNDVPSARCRDNQAKTPCHLRPFLAGWPWAGYVTFLQPQMHQL